MAIFDEIQIPIGSGSGRLDFAKLSRLFYLVESNGEDAILEVSHDCAE